MRLQSRPSKLLRLVWVAATLCGLLLQPVLAAMGDLHALEHAMAVDGEHAHDPGHGHDHAHNHPQATTPSGDLPHEATGLHELLHTHAGMSAAALLGVPFFQGEGPESPRPSPVMRDTDPLTLHLGSPFRPPIG
ncbi:hypothetical protein [Silanimonas sp.]|uniref:hypothetical protein n=1 Tax=Silanimonas sp. TaxID=1929290 RepID=UPI001BC110AC|nr:hypothetical protein [Silanimonas sp.]MBS3895845.1 hypothetical protein [Silanimonas sp.]MBS3924850.1 hypothetical protein [Xanthomonadaceae bacterium]